VKPEVFLRLVEGLFSNRRKKVKKALAALGVSKEKLTGMDATLLDKRPEELAPDQAAELAIATHLFN
jgi:16S rRNA (adenine1518-N6/adenine1519-N6)-dimethyltransferase